MKVLAIVSSIAAVVGLSAAAPSANAEGFQIVSHSSDSRFANMCVYAYHTGAGFNDATLGTCKGAPTFSYNNGKLTTKLGTSDTYGWTDFDSTTYDDFYPPAINIGAGASGVGYNSTFGFSSPQKTGFLGCRWAHGGVPQVFAIAYPGAATFVPCNCAHINLFQQ